MLKRSHTLYLTSKYRDNGSTFLYTISLPEVIQSDPNLERFKISLHSFTTYNDWFIIKQGANTIRVNGFAYTIPDGNYPYQRLAKTIQSVVPNSTVVWNTDTNTMTLSFTGSRTIRFDDIGNTLGFTPNMDFTGTTFTSQSPMNPYPDPYLMIHLQNISPMAEHLVFSNHTGEVRVASILAKVLINASPFQLITHNQILESDGIYTTENTVGQLEILITDSEGRPFIDMPEHSLCLTIESVDVEDYDSKTIIDELKQIKSWVRDILSLKVYKNRRP
jgi:hypothetical protein